MLACLHPGSPALGETNCGYLLPWSCRGCHVRLKMMLIWTPCATGKSAFASMALCSSQSPAFPESPLLSAEWLCPSPGLSASVLLPRAHQHLPKKLNLLNFVEQNFQETVFKTVVHIQIIIGGSCYFHFFGNLNTRRVQKFRQLLFLWGSMLTYPENNFQNTMRCLKLFFYLDNVCGLKSTFCSVCFLGWPCQVIGNKKQVL